MLYCSVLEFFLPILYYTNPRTHSLRLALTRAFVCRIMTTLRDVELITENWMHRLSRWRWFSRWANSGPWWVVKWRCATKAYCSRGDNQSAGLSYTTDRTWPTAAPVIAWTNAKQWGGITSTRGIWPAGDNAYRLMTETYAYATRTLCYYIIYIYIYYLLFIYTDQTK